MVRLGIDRNERFAAMNDLTAIDLDGDGGSSAKALINCL
jgi:hypothetical protein